MKTHNVYRIEHFEEMFNQSSLFQLIQLTKEEKSRDLAKVTFAITDIEKTRIFANVNIISSTEEMFTNNDRCGCIWIGKIHFNTDYYDTIRYLINYLNECIEKEDSHFKRLK